MECVNIRLKATFALQFILTLFENYKQVKDILQIVDFGKITATFAKNGRQPPSNERPKYLLFIAKVARNFICSYRQVFMPSINGDLLNPVSLMKNKFLVKK